MSNIEPSIPEPENDNISENIQEEAIPTGVSIESASYIESTNENSLISDDEDTIY